MQQSLIVTFLLIAALAQSINIDERARTRFVQSHGLPTGVFVAYFSQVNRQFLESSISLQYLAEAALGNNRRGFKLLFSIGDMAGSTMYAGFAVSEGRIERVAYSDSAQDVMALVKIVDFENGEKKEEGKEEKKEERKENKVPVERNHSIYCESMSAAPNKDNPINIGMDELKKISKDKSPDFKLPATLGALAALRDSIVGEVDRKIDQLRTDKNLALRLATLFTNPKVNDEHPGNINADIYNLYKDYEKTDIKKGQQANGSSEQAANPRPSFSWY